MRLDEQHKPLPTEGLPLTTPVEPFEEAPSRFGHKHVHRYMVIGHPIVLEVSSQLSTECRPEFWEPTPVPHVSCPGTDPLELLAQTRATGLHLRDHRPAS